MKHLWTLLALVFVFVASACSEQMTEPTIQDDLAPQFEIVVDPSDANTYTYTFDDVPCRTDIATYEDLVFSAPLRTMCGVDWNVVDGKVAVFLQRETGERTIELPEAARSVSMNVSVRRGRRIIALNAYDASGALVGTTPMYVGHAGVSNVSVTTSGAAIFRVGIATLDPRSNWLELHDLSVTVPGTDMDGDGVPDDEDAFPNSNLDEFVSHGVCSTDVANHLFENGATFMDLIGEALAGAKNHGQFVSAVTRMANAWTKDGLISGSDKGVITSCAASG